MLPDREQTLRPRDWLVVVFYALAVWSVPFLVGPFLGAHETVHCLNTREMLASGDLIIPTYGGRPWLERPPLPFWITGAFVALTGQADADWPYRLGSMAMGLLTVLLVVGMAARWLGRNLAVLSGLILASMREFYIYSSNAEADIFLCAVMTLALAFFARAEFTRPLEGRDRNPFGSRPWEVLAFFATAGLMNLTKGLFFGTLIAGAVVVAYLLMQRDLLRVRRYVWVWGVLAYLAVSVPWPLLAAWRCPGIVALWESDYLGRMHGTYMREPWWYYLANLPWNIFPWTLAAFLGLWLARPGRASASDSQLSPQAYSFLLAWGVAPVLGLSLATGKHHHYLLHVTAPWAIFAALGTVACWDWLRARLPGLLTPARAVPAAGVLFALVFGGVLAAYATWNHLVQVPRFADDHAFLQRTLREVPSDAAVVLANEPRPLNASWWLHYSQGRVKLLHHYGFLRQNTIESPTVYVIAPAGDEQTLRQYGQVQPLFASESTWRRVPPEPHWTLFRLTRAEGLKLVSPPSISPMQATGRAPGPDLR